MRIFHGFLIVAVAVILFMLPISDAVYGFRTDVREDDFFNVTGAGVTTANVTLIKPVYDDDTDTISILSTISTDTPIYASYNTTTRLLGISGLAESSNRTLTVSYDVSALNSNVALGTLMDWTPYIWYLLIIVLPIGGLWAIIKGRA